MRVLKVSVIYIYIYIYRLDDKDYADCQSCKEDVH